MDAVLRKARKSFSEIHRDIFDTNVKVKPNSVAIKRRIAYIVSHGQSYATNGYAIRTQKIAKELQNSGFEPICMVRPGRPWELAEPGFDIPIEKIVDGIKHVHTPWRGGIAPKGDAAKFNQMVDSFIELFKVYRPEVVLAASNHEISLPALVAARLMRLPFHYEVRGFWEVSKASRTPSYQGSLGYQLHYQRECYVARCADKVYTLNQAMVDELHERGVARDKISLVPNAITELPKPLTKTTIREQYNLPDNAKLLGYVGSITEYEGLDELIEALAAQDQTTYLMIVGGYNAVTANRNFNDPIFTSLKRQIDKLKLNDRVLFTGRIDHDKLNNYYAAFDALVIPRKDLPVCELVSGLKPVEYMGYGLPIIASDVAPHKEVFANGERAWLYKKSDILSLSKTIKTVLSLTESEKKLKTDKSIQAIREHYLWGRTIKPLVDGLKQAITPVQVRPKIACIMDEFTYLSYAPEAEFEQLTPQNWREELENFLPDMLFIESAWRGKDELWGSKVGHKSQEVVNIVKWCNTNGVPTVFWNKEDPVHFETFLNTAKLFDFVFTTDLDCVHRYKGALGHNRVYFLPFAAQPKLTNPIETYKRKDAFCFAGAYYVKYPDRTRDLETFVEEFPKYKPLEIYDRNYGKDDPNYMFPESYQPHIVGKLPFSEIDKAYKGYRYAINLNSIKQSQTMFARRVYELLCSNTITVSNFSRGIRLMFGDLVQVSDSGREIVERLQQIESTPEHADKFRLAGLRKVLSEHTYEDRLNYIVSKVIGRKVQSALPVFQVIAKVSNQEELDVTLANFNRQNYAQKKLLLVCGGELNAQTAKAQIAETQGQPNKNLNDAVEVVDAKAVNNRQVSELAGDNSWIAAFHAADYYGDNYLTDIALATRFTDADAIGKAAHYEAISRADDTSPARLKNRTGAYKGNCDLPLRASAIRAKASSVTITDLVEKLESGYCGSFGVEGLSQQAIDTFNYAKGFAKLNEQAKQQVIALVSDAHFDNGLSIHELTDLAERTEPTGATEDQIPSFSAKELTSIFATQGTKNVRLKLSDHGIDVNSTLSDGNHEYVYIKGGNELKLSDLLVEGKAELSDANVLPLHLEMTPGLNLSLVVIFFDEKGQRLHHNIIQANKNSETPIPEHAHKVKLGYRVYQSGQSIITKLLIGQKDLSPPNVLAPNDVLVLTNNYPSYDELYKNGFVHSRVKAYREYGQEVDIFRFKKNQPLSWHEYQDVDVITGSKTALDRMMATGQYRHVFVHFLEPDMWDVLAKYIDMVKVTVWVHGAEIHPWWRRKYNIETEAQEEHAKAQSEIRMAFWRGILKPMHSNLHLVFVSNYFASEVMEDIGFELPKSQYSVIHNPINTELFNYIEKPAEQRKKILSIRPFASRQYANDITVAAILELSKEDFFHELEFRIIGDGPLFESTVEPIRHFDNVTLEKRFVAQPEIARLHKEYGVFLCPTRWDSQGVSRDEAMASGLAVVTTATAAIPEFTDEECAFVAKHGNPQSVAYQLKHLIKNERAFLDVSKKASQRIIKKLDNSVIIPFELSFLKNKRRITLRI